MTVKATAPFRVSGLCGAFTFTELLVVIGIIAILAALSLPALSGAKANSRRILCSSNLKQLQTAWQMYLGDHSDNMPPNFWNGVGGASAGSAPGSWVVGNVNDPGPTNIQNGVLWSYTTSLPIYRCPMDTSMVPGGNIPRWRSYSLLNYLGATPVGPTTGPNLYVQRGTQLKSASPVMAFACEDADSINDGIFFVYAPPATEWKDYPSSRHSSGCTFSFCDGHVEYWKWSYGQPNDTDLERVQAALPQP
jgi:prepilin-type processing-associated H-X9-DG protein/prepilin-type N-terminal cleavage/methylation domain-containing protein